MTHRSTSAPVRFLAAAATLCASLLLGCGEGTDFGNDSLPTPFVAFGGDLDTCSPAGSVMLAIVPEDTRITLDAPAQTPRNRASVSGVAVGLGPDDEVFLVVTPADASCPLALVAATTLQPSGAFTGIVDLGERTRLRITAVAFDGVAGDVSCDAAADCVAFAAGLLGVSQSIEIGLN